PMLMTGEPLGATTVISPSLAEMRHGCSMMSRGQVLAQPGMLVNSPSALDPSLVSAGRHVFSLEVLYTPYRLNGGWADSDEPRRWLDQVATALAPGFLDS